MNSSGIKRGLAVSAITALAVTGVPAIANAVTLSTQQGTGVTLRSVEDNGTASIANDGKNNTVSLVATAAAGYDDDADTATPDLAIEHVAFYRGSVAPANLIGVAGKSATGEFQLEWTPPVGVTTTDIIAVASDAAGTPTNNAGTLAEDTASNVTVSGTASTVEISPNSGDLGYFPQPNDGTGDGLAYATGNNVAGISGSTSDTAPTVVTGAGASVGVAGGSITAGSADSNGIRQWVGTVNVAGSALDADSNVADQILPVVETTDNTRDAQGFNLYKQTIGNITATASPADPDTGLGDVTVTVVDTQGKPVAGAHVVRENATGGTPTDGLTNGNGQITFANAASGNQSYYVDTTDDSGFNTGIDYRTSVTVSAARPDKITFTSLDGSAFDWDEYESGDIRVKVTDASGNALAGQRVFYKWSYTGFKQDADGESGTTAEMNGVTNSSGILVISRPTNADFPASANVDNLADGESGGSLTLNAYVNRDGSNPGQDPVDLAMDPATIKTGESIAEWNAPTETDREVGTTQTVSGSLYLADGTALNGRTLNVSYAPGDNSVLSATQPSGTTRLSNTTARVVTDADGNFSVSITDPQKTPQTEESGVLSVTGTATVGSGASAKNGVGTDATDSVTVNFVANATPAAIYFTDQTDLIDSEATPGRPVQVEIRVVNANGNPLAGQDVTLKTDHGFFTPDADTEGDLVPAATPTEGALYGVWKNLGDEVTVTTDSNGYATATVAIEKDAGFNDDGDVTANITATSGPIDNTDPNSDAISVDFHSGDPLNNGGLEVSQSAQQTVSVLPKAPTTEMVYYDVHAMDQFGNLVENENVTVSTDHGFINSAATGSSDVVDSSVTDDDFAFALGANSAGDATPDGSWTTEANTYVDSDPLTPGFQPDVRTTNKTVSDEGETVNFYEIDFANSTYTLTHDTADTVKVGTTVIETYSAVDQNGEPMSGVGVEFFRNGPDTQQTGEDNESGFTNAAGKASYVFSGTEAGTGTIQALITDSNGVAAGGSAVPESRATDQVTFEGDAVPDGGKLWAQMHMKVIDHGKRDVIKINARDEASGARVILFKRKGHSLKRIKSAVLNQSGDYVFRVHDGNKNRFTRYTVKLKGTDVVRPANKSRRVR